MKIEKEKCLRCEGKGCVECSYSGVIFKNTEFKRKINTQRGIPKEAQASNENKRI